MVLMLALDSTELDVRAVGLVPGNGVAVPGLDYALHMIALANRCGIQAAGGAQHPRFQKFMTAEFWHGQNGLANKQLPPSRWQIDSRLAPDRILPLIHRSPQAITLVPIGPLTKTSHLRPKEASRWARW